LKHQQPQWQCAKTEIARNSAYWLIYKFEIAQVTYAAWISA